MYKSNVNLNLYITFYEVAKYGSISEAAKRLFDKCGIMYKKLSKPK